eukprot:749445-Hanusia_phi.AAC.2
MQPPILLTLMGERNLCLLPLLFGVPPRPLLFFSSPSPSPLLPSSPLLPPSPPPLHSFLRRVVRVRDSPSKSGACWSAEVLCAAAAAADAVAGGISQELDPSRRVRSHVRGSEAAAGERKGK